MKQEKTITCTVCPKGCQVTVTFDEQGNVSKITGNSCDKGEKYARSELVNPMRVLTSTVRVSGGIKPVISVKTSQPVPLKTMMACMADVNRIRLAAPVRIGDVIKENLAETGAALVATSGTEQAGKNTF